MARERSKEPEPDAKGDEVQYGAAVREIEQILASIDRDEIDLDELGQKVERAVDLLKVCRTKLKATEARVTQVLKDLAKEEAADAAAAEGDDEPEADGASEPGAAGAEDAEAGTPDGAAAKRKGRKKKDDDDDELPF